MSTDEYVPEEEDFIDSWACTHVTPHDMTAEEAKERLIESLKDEAKTAAFLACVRRDAAREALDGLADEATHVNWEMDGPSFALRVRRFKNRKYPEEAP